MLTYQNLSNTTKTFYGVTFKPGEYNSVPGYINDPKFVRLDRKPEEPPKPSVNQKTTDTTKGHTEATKSPKMQPKSEKVEVAPKQDDKPKESPKPSNNKEEKDGTDSN